MIRPSSLALAESCTMSAELSARFPNKSDAADRGTEIHREIARWIAEGVKPSSADALALMSVWSPPDGAEVEVAATLLDPEGGHTLTGGTADCVWVDADILHVVDWKTGMMDSVDEAASNLQIAAYGAALALSRGLDAYRAALCFVRPDGPIWDWTDVVRGHDMWAPIERIAAIVRRPVIATTGPHCGRCYTRTRCEAYLLPAVVSRDLTLAATTEQGMVAAERVAEVYTAAQAMADLAERARDWCKAQLEEHGGAIRVGDKELAMVQQAGKRSVSVKDVEAAGRADLIKQGPAFTSLRWRAVKAHLRGKQA